MPQRELIRRCILFFVSLIFFAGQLEGTREGTILSALLVGVTVKLFRRHLQKPLTHILTK